MRRRAAQAQHIRWSRGEQVPQAWGIGLVGLLLLVPDVALTFAGRSPIWARTLAAFGVVLLGYDFLQRIGGAGGLGQPVVIVGLIIGFLLPFGIESLLVRMRSGREEQAASDPGDRRWDE